jgi:transcriptional regulator with XRE-family HTH domain
MLPNSREINPLNWPLLIKEAVQRRKAEKLTQRKHAALAGVSVPTIAAFERGDQSLSLTKAFDILRVVGLIEEENFEDAQNSFVKKASARWQGLISQMPKYSPARFSNGWYQFDYHLEGELKSPDLETFKKNLVLANKTTYTGWPPFLVVTDRKDSIFTPYPIEGVYECWLQPRKDSFNDAAHCDYWCADPTGRMFLIRGYQEDAVETFPAGSIFDSVLPIWRMSEVLLHAERLALLLQKNPTSSLAIHFRAIYSGLSGRVLRSWSNPSNSTFLEEGAARGDEVVLTAALLAKDVSTHLSQYIYPLVSSLYERFGIQALSQAFVHNEVERLLNSPNRFIPRRRRTP